MSRQWCHYSRWEDWRAGMYRLTADEIEIAGASALLSCAPALARVMLSVCEQWPTATAYRLTATGVNRRAWLGQAACCLEYGASQRATCVAWNALTPAVQSAANRAADHTISAWEGARDYAETLFA